MPPRDLLGAVEQLVDVATGGADERALRAAVNAVVKAFDAGDTKAARAAIRLLGAGVKRADGRAIQVLDLTIGALVENGAPPEIAWKVVHDGFVALLDGAVLFARACTSRAGNASAEAFAAVAFEVAGQRPRDASSWREVPARCLAAVACLTRSRKLRIQACADHALIGSLLPLAEAFDEAGFLLQILRMIDGETVTVVHPATKRGVRVELRDVASNLELVTLLAGMLDAKDAKRAKKGGAAKAKPKKGSVRTKLDPVAFTNLGRDGSLPKPKAKHDHASLLEGVPADFPLFGEERVVLLRDVPARNLPTEASFPGLVPEIRVKRTLAPADVEAILHAITRARSPGSPGRGRKSPRR